MRERSLNALRCVSVVLLAFWVSGQVSAQTSSKGVAKKAPAAATAESDPDLPLARKAALEWLALVDAYKFDATWDQAATSFQKAQNKANWSKAFADARPTMGKLISRTFLNHEIRTVLPDNPPGKYVTLRFTSVFENHKGGAESVTLTRDGARGFRMISYILK